MAKGEKLGAKPTAPSEDLELWPAPHPNQLVQLEDEELTALCPVTKQPDFYKIFIDYMPAGFIVELKSLKLYIWSFRDEAMGHEKLCATIFEKLLVVLQPQHLRVILKVNIRGGIKTTVTNSTKDSDLWS